MCICSNTKIDPLHFFDEMKVLRRQPGRKSSSFSDNFTNFNILWFRRHCSVQDYNTMTRLGVELRPLDRKSTALKTVPVHLP